VIDLLVVGDANPDVLLSGAPETPPAGQAETLVDSGTLTLGGSAAIMACGAARLGLSTALAATVGRDAAGDFVLDTLRTAGVDVSAVVRHPDLPTALTVCLNRADGDRAILTAPGCLPAFDPSLVPTGIRARHVHAASYFLQPGLAAGLAALFAGFRRTGASTSLDTNDDPASSWRLAPGLLAACDFLLPNEAEALSLAGALGPVSDLASALSVLADAGPVPVVKRGGDGAVARSSGRDVVAQGPRVVPVDTVGAGDGFDAGFVAGYLSSSGDLASALAWGCACGALSTRAAGGTGAQATEAEARSAASRVRVRTVSE
jgi:sugar/nucleoside kinase (ribokinase family)